MLREPQRLPTDSDLSFLTAQTDLLTHDKKNLEGDVERAFLKKKTWNNSSVNDLFRNLRSQNNTRINRHLDERGTMLLEAEDLLQHATKFYKQLYSGTTSRTSVDHFLQCLRPENKFPKLLELNRPFPLSEIKSVLSSISAQICPGPEILPFEF